MVRARHGPPVSEPPGPGGALLVVLQGEPTDEPLVELACTLARATGASLRALWVIEVPRSRPLGEWDETAERRARAALAAAAAIAQRRGCTLRSTVLPARDFGAAILDEASEWAPRLVLLAFPAGGPRRAAVERVVAAAPPAVLLWRPPRAAE
jgi:nucleotide-binding universal stress UspA family protein